MATAPIPADGAQARAIAAARAGHSFVLEGPPGTGKSQTITNILADQLAQGRRVLFVAEKGAALDVVRHRLGEIGLLPYALDLHDHNARPVEVRARIRTALAQRARPDLDGYRAALGEVEGSASALRGYAQRLHRANRAGLSLWSARATALARGCRTDVDGAAGRPERQDAAAGGETAAGIDLARLRRLVAGAADDLGALDPEVARAWGFVGVGETPVDPGAVLALLPAADAAVTAATVALGQVTPGAAELLRRAATWSQLHDLVELLAAPVTGHELAELGSPRWAAARAELTARTDTWRRSAAPVLADFTPDVLGVDLGPVRQELRIAEHSFFLGRKGRLLTAAGPVLVHLRPGRELSPKELPARVETLATLAEQHRAVVAGWQALPGLGWLPAEANLLSDAGTAQLTAATARRRRAGGRARSARPPGGRRDDRRTPGRARARHRDHPGAHRGAGPARRGVHRDPQPAARPGGVRGGGSAGGLAGRHSRRARPTARTVGRCAGGSGPRRHWSRWPPTCRKPAGSCSAPRSSGPTRSPRSSAGWPRVR